MNKLITTTVAPLWFTLEIQGWEGWIGKGGAYCMWAQYCMHNSKASTMSRDEIEASVPISGCAHLSKQGCGGYEKGLPCINSILNVWQEPWPAQNAHQSHRWSLCPKQGLR